MRNIIEELYYGNITPCDRDIIKGGSYAHLLHLVTRNEDELMQTLTQAQQENFEKFKDCASEINDANELTAFAIGFKLGMLLALEAMISTRPRKVLNFFSAQYLWDLELQKVLHLV